MWLYDMAVGTKYSIAKPGSRGRYEGELLLREDQLLSGTVYVCVMSVYLWASDHDSHRLYFQTHLLSRFLSLSISHSVLFSLFEFFLNFSSSLSHSYKHAYTNTHTHTYTIFLSLFFFLTLYLFFLLNFSHFFCFLFVGIWRQKNVKIKKNVISFFGADVTSDVGMHVNKGLKIKLFY